MNTDKLSPAVWRVCFAASLAALVSPALAQTAATGSSSTTSRTSSSDEQPIVLSPFEVQMTQDKGYYSSNSANALKTDEKIMEIPQSITVVTRSMIEDLGSGNLSDALNYAGVGNIFQGDTAVVRGQRVNMLTNGSGDGQQQGPTFDSSMIDSITIVRGPSAVLYGLQSSLGGMVQKNTRMPLPKRAGSITLATDQFGLMRGEIDYSTPLGAIGESKFSTRVDVSHQDGKTYFKNSDNDRDVGYLAFQMRRPETTVRLAGSYQLTEMIPHRNTFIGADGVPYIGAGRDEDYQPPGMRVKRSDQRLSGQVMQRLFPGWDMAASLSFNRNSYSQGVMLGNLVDFQNREVRFSARWNRLAQRIYVGDLGVIGKYTLFGRPAQTYIGALFNDTTNNPTFFPGDSAFGTNNAGRGTGFRAAAANVLAVPMDNPQSERIAIRQESDYYPILGTAAGNRGQRQFFMQHNESIQQRIDIVPNRLLLTASLSQFNQYNETENITSPTPATITATSIQRQHRLLHRVGLVYNVTKNLSLYAIKSTTIVVQTSRLIDGTITPPQDGEQKEVGMKADFGDGRFSFTGSLYDVRLTNVGVNPGVLSPITGLSYVNLIGQTVNKGGDLSLATRPTKTWYLSFNFDMHYVHDQNGNARLANTNTGSWGFFTRYDFTADPLKKFAIGGGANRFFNRYVSATNFRYENGTTPAGNGTTGSTAVLKLADGTGSTFFIDYKATKRLTFKVTVNNVLDEVYAVGAQHAFCIDPSVPRNWQLTAFYRF